MIPNRKSRGARGAAAVVLATALIAAARPAVAVDCAEAKNGLTFIMFDTGQTDLTPLAREKLETFASRAKYKDVVCVFGQVDAQGGDSALNRQIARTRAFNVSLFLTSRGVAKEKIHVDTQDAGFTLFGALDSDQPADRRVKLTHE